jgi:predicted transposase YdaD
MLDYWVRLYRLYRLPITQVVVLLLPPPATQVIETGLTLENTSHQYRVIRLWEENPELFLHDPALLPLAPLTATNEPQALLQQVVEQVNELEGDKRTEISAYAQIVAGLKYEKDLVKQLFQEGMMRESVIYQDIIQEGQRSLILRQLTRRVGELPQLWRDRVSSLSLEQLENLGEALLDFQGITDLETWWSQFNEK